ncbi:MAG: hypothetical protein PHP37_00625 [Patescibacteria group bacterium]|nr:hypothetical protein [Patescibacteria group bacterium]
MNNLSKETIKILEIIEKFGPIRSSEIVKISKISIKNIYKHLTRLLDEDLIKKNGNTPKVYYSIKLNKDKNLVVKSIKDYFIEQNYIYLSPNGDIIRGIDGFSTWCEKNNFDFEKEKDNFYKKLKVLNKNKKDELFSAKNKILAGKNKVYLDDIYFSDFYTFDYFGKTKLGQLVYLGKTSQDKKIIKEIVRIVNPAIEKIINKKKIDFVGFIPPTIDRKIQFMDVFKKELNIELENIIISKTSGDIKIPQKTLRKLEDRIINANETISVKPSQEIKGNVLIIDDATGSGATLNEVAKKIKNINKNVKVFGYSVVGSYKNFDVISEV